MATLNTDNFPDISFIEDTTIDEVLNQMIDDFLAKYEEITGEKIALARANPYRLIMYASAVQIYQGMQYADYAGKMSFLTYARGDYLDNLAALRGIVRKKATAAITTLEFSIDAPISSVVAIPAGCRATNGNNVFFSTDEYAEIKAGETSVTVSATCTDKGTAGNGFAPGEINTVVNTLPYVVSVRNTTETYNGSEIESDEDLKERIYEAPDGYSTAGSAGAYKFHVKNASTNIGDVVVDSPEPGIVDVYFVMDDGTLPSEAMINMVQEKLEDRTVRPLTDEVRVKAPSTEPYNVDITYYIPDSSKSAVPAIQTAVEAAVSAYNIWQTSSIGKDINPDYLTRKVMDAGAKRVIIRSPSYQVLNESTIAQVGTVTITYGGVEND